MKDCTITITATISNEIPTINANIENNTLSLSSSVEKYGAYNGSYEFNPSEAVQIVKVNGCVMYDDITINPIPANYGQIVWNGATITII